jgi:beta-lactamase regulating signal transducer with metallopeptidase domain
MTGALASHIWQSTWFAVAVGLLTLAFRRNRARVRYVLWLCASAKFLVPFALLISVGGRLGQRHATETLMPVVVEQIAAGFVEPSRFVSSPPATRATVDWRPIAIGVWACGFLGIVWIRLRGWQRVRAALRASEPLHIPVAVEVRSATGLLEPGVVGLLRPVMLLPEGIVEQLSPAQLEAVLAHELCHVRRRDNLFAAMHMVVEGMFWFHPLVWWVGARMVEERERACDEGVLNLGSEPRTYAEAILGVCKLYVESPLVCVSGVTGADLKKRIEAIMSNRIGLGLNFTKKLLLGSAGAAALVGPVVMGVIVTSGHIPVLRAQSQVAVPAVAQTVLAPQTANPNVAAQMAQPQGTTVAAPDRRLLTLLLDCGSMTAGEQVRAREAAIQFVQTRMESNAVMSVMVATNGKLAVVQDFTADKTLLTSAIAGAGSSTASSVVSQLETLEQAARMLGAIPGKKSLIYFSNGSLQHLRPEDLQPALMAAQQSTVAFYPVDVSGGESQDLRVAEARAKFGTTSSIMARTYIRYGPPDQIEDRGTAGQVWRYNYIDELHSRAEFELWPASGFRMLVNWPPPTATYTGTPRPLGEVIADLQRAGVSASASQYSAFPSGHITVKTYPPSLVQVVTVPTNGLNGKVDIIGDVRGVLSTGDRQVTAKVRDWLNLSQPDGTGLYQTNFSLNAGSYVANVLVREVDTGKVYSEAISFDVR